MNFCNPKLLTKLKIWQQNIHKSKTAHEYILDNANPEDWEVIALQEPWIDKYSNSCGTQYWCTIYPANLYEEGWAQICSMLFINTNLSTDCYTLIPIKHSNVTMVQFRGDNSFLSLFNIYNEITNNDMLTCLDQFSDLNASML
jgi:hypothetical protein